MSKNKKIVLISIIFALLTLAATGGAAAVYFSGSLKAAQISESMRYSNKYASEFIQRESVPDAPQSVRGAFLVSGEEFLKNEDDEIQKVKSDIDAAIADVKNMNFNAVFISAINKGEIKKISSKDGGELLNTLEYCVKKVQEQGLYTFCCVDASDIINVSDFSVKGDFLTTLCSSYGFKGFLLTGLDKLEIENSKYNKEETTEKISTAVKYAAWYVKQAKPDAFFGVQTPAVWANSEANKNGSKTKAAYQGLTDGCLDALTWAKRGIVDYILVNAEYSTKDAKAPFETVVKWWDAELKASPAKLIIGHSAYKICSADYEGWKSPDELIRQASVVGKLERCLGSAFYTYNALKKDEQNSAKVLLGYYNGQIEDKLIFNELVVTSLSSKPVKVHESVIKVAGSSDPNFPLMLNGQEISRSEYGYFSKDVNLTPGKNTIKLTHKGTEKSYCVEYERILIQSVSPTAATYAMGGSTLTLSAVAFKNSTVYAEVKDQRVDMKLSAVANDEFNISDGSDFVKYEGAYTLPESTDKEQNLGSVKFYCVNNGYKYSLTGGSVTVNKLVKNATMVEVKSIAEVRSAKSTGSKSEPQYTPLIKGTLDFYAGDVTVDGSKYYVLKSGRRVLASNVTVKNIESMTDNTLQLVSAQVSQRTTALNFKTGWNVPFNVITGSQGVKIDSYDIGYIDIKFDYSPFASGNADFSGSDVIKSAEWIKDGDKAHILRVHLKKAGGFYGYNAAYNADGTLTIEFKNHSSGSLSGKVIVIDAGHGATDEDGLDPGALGSNPNYHEYAMTWAMANKVKELLEAKGATVKFTRSSKITTMLMPERVQKIIDFNADASISIHLNSSPSSAPFGTETYYYYSHSAALAKNIHLKLVSTYENNIYAAGTPSSDYDISRGAKYGEYKVTRITGCPSVLVETGFISNQKEYAALINDIKGDNLIARAIVDGVEEYFQNR